MGQQGIGRNDSSGIADDCNAGRVEGWRALAENIHQFTVLFDHSPKNLDNAGFRGEVAEWLMAADCKSALLRVRWFESSPLHHSFTEQVKSIAMRV